MKKHTWIDLAIVAFVTILLMLFFVSCKTQAPIARTDTVTKTIIKERVRDTTIFITDSAGFRALLECDSLGQVRVKQIQDFYAGQFVKPKIVIKDNYIKLDCQIDSAKIFLMWLRRDTLYSVRSSSVVIQKENYITGFQWFQIWSGRVFFALLMVFLGVKVLKRYTGLKLPF